MKISILGLDLSSCRTTEMQRLSALGLTCLTDTRFQTLNAIQATGTKTASFAVSRGGVAATYFDANGVMQSTTTDNAVRYTYGYYDATGWHAYPGGAVAMLEGQAKNELTHSITYENAAWDKTNVTAADNSAVSPDGTSNASTLTASADNGTVLLNTAVTASAYSVFLKRKTGTGAIYITANGGTTWTAVTLTSSWTRPFEYKVSASQKCGIKFATNGDAVYAYISQFENQMYPSSAILTAGSALTRAAESLTYVANDGNFPAPSGNNCLSFDGTNDYVSLGDISANFDGGTVFDATVDVYFRKITGESDLLSDEINYIIRRSGTSIQFINNFTTASWNTMTATFTVAANTKYRIRVTYNGTVKKIYVDNIEVGSSNITDTFRTTTNNTVLGYRTTGSDNLLDGFMYYASITGASGLVAQYTFTDNDVASPTTLADQSGNGHNGTISGATWSKDTHAGTVVLAYRPVMLPSEQSASYKRLWNIINDASNEHYLSYDTNANNKVAYNTESNANAIQALSGALSGWTRNGLRVLAGTFSTTADGAGKKINLYDNAGTAVTSATYAPPAGSLPATFSVQPTAGQAMHYVGLAIFNRVLTAAEVAQVYRYFGGT